MAVDKTQLVNVEGLEEFGRVVKNYVDMHGSGTTIHDLVELTEGSKYINVDLNEEATRLVVSLDLTNLDTTPSDTDNLITSGGVYTALQGKLDSNRTAVSNVGGLVKPLSTPTATELVGISTAMEQERVKIGDGLSYDTTTKTLTATGGGGGGGTGGTKLYRHIIVTNLSNGSAVVLYSMMPTPYTGELTNDINTNEVISGFVIGSEGEGTLLYCDTGIYFLVGGQIKELTDTTIETDTVTPL